MRLNDFLLSTPTAPTPAAIIRAQREAAENKQQTNYTLFLMSYVLFVFPALTAPAPAAIIRAQKEAAARRAMRAATTVTTASTSQYHAHVPWVETGEAVSAQV